MASHTWPAARALVQSIQDLDTSVLRNAIVVELGAGTGEAGIAVARLTCACHLIQTDCYPEVVDKLRERHKQLNHDRDHWESLQENHSEAEDETTEKDGRRSDVSGEVADSVQLAESTVAISLDEDGKETEGKKECVDDDDDNTSDPTSSSDSLAQTSELGVEALVVDWFDPLTVNSMFLRIVDIAEKQTSKTGVVPGLLLICSDGTFTHDVLEPLFCSIAQLLGSWHTFTLGRVPSQCFITHVDREPEYLEKILELTKSLHLKILSTSSSSEPDHVDFMREVRVGIDASSLAAILLWIIKLDSNDLADECINE